MLYTNKKGKNILMVQTWADRREWGGPSYHITKPQKRPLKWALKVYGSRTHPVPENIAVRCIQNAINNIIDLRPDIVGLGGMGKTARKIRAGLENGGCKAEIAYWEADAEIDASQFLERYGVDPPY
jgi:hypothetical protein